METIIVKPKDAKQAAEGLAALKKMQVEAKLHSGPIDGLLDELTDEEIIASIERGMTEVHDYKTGKLKLQDAKSLLNEL